MSPPPLRHALVIKDSAATTRPGGSSLYHMLMGNVGVKGCTRGNAKTTRNRSSSTVGHMSHMNHYSALAGANEGSAGGPAATPRWLSRKRLVERAQARLLRGAGGGWCPLRCRCQLVDAAAHHHLHHQHMAMPPLPPPRRHHHPAAATPPRPPTRRCRYPPPPRPPAPLPPTSITTATTGMTMMPPPLPRLVRRCPSVRHVSISLLRTSVQHGSRGWAP